MYTSRKLQHVRQRSSTRIESMASLKRYSAVQSALQTTAIHLWACLQDEQDAYGDDADDWQSSSPSQDRYAAFDQHATDVQQKAGSAAEPSVPAVPWCRVTFGGYLSVTSGSRPAGCLSGRLLHWSARAWACCMSPSAIHTPESGQPSPCLAACQSASH